MEANFKQSLATHVYFSIFFLQSNGDGLFTAEISGGGTQNVEAGGGRDMVTVIQCGYMISYHTIVADLKGLFMETKDNSVLPSSFLLHDLINVSLLFFFSTRKENHRY